MTRCSNAGKQVLRDTVKARSGVAPLIDYGKWTDGDDPAPAWERTAG